jgi:septal ring factor EnvC (AmiA/AmiB activator)
LADGPPDNPPSNGAQHQLALIRRERDKLAKQIQDSKDTLAKSQALIERLDALLAKLDSKQ